MPGKPKECGVSLELTLEADLPPPEAITVSRLHSLAVFALSEEGATGAWEIGLLFTTDMRIQAMHREFMNLDSPTDIMTFPFEQDGFPEAEIAENGGDIVISIETADLHAGDAGWSLTDELLFLTLHGVLHLLGWDDAEEVQRARMLARQSQLLDRWRDYAGEATG